MLFTTKYDRIADCTLHQLHILRTGPAEFVLRILVPQGQLGPNSETKLQRWTMALVLLSPDLPIKTVLSSSPPLRLHQAPPDGGQWLLHQAEDGIHWFCHGNLPALYGVSRSERLAFVDIYMKVRPCIQSKPADSSALLVCAGHNV